MHKLIKKIKHQNTSVGFTIVELLVVIVVIGILAAITVVSYTGISSKATVASLQSDLNSAKKQLNLYFVDNGAYPTSLSSNCPVLSGVTDNRYCLKPSSGNTFTYTNVAPSTFNLKNTNSSNNASYSITNNSQPILATTTFTCPTGFIPVPGSGTYNTTDFCVMKYEAKADDNGDGIGDTNQTTGYNTWPTSAYPISASRKLVSSAAGYPIAVITQATALNVASNYVYGCSDCHLITSAEWMTIAQNVLSVASNWSTGVIGSGYIFSGHNDNAPANALVADTNDSNGYYGETNTGGNQRRTLTLSNGQVIWDFSSNIYEWLFETPVGGQPGVTGGGYAWRQWTSITNPGSISPYPGPTSTGISGAINWTSANGIGYVYSSVEQTATRAIYRSCDWNMGAVCGVLTMGMDYTSTGVANNNIGFRVSR